MSEIKPFTEEEMAIVLKMDAYEFFEIVRNKDEPKISEDKFNKLIVTVTDIKEQNEILGNYAETMKKASDKAKESARVIYKQDIEELMYTLNQVILASVHSESILNDNETTAKLLQEINNAKEVYKRFRHYIKE